MYVNVCISGHYGHKYSVFILRIITYYTIENEKIVLQRSQYLFIGLQMRRHFQIVMSEHRIIWDFAKAKHGRLSKVNHKPENNSHMRYSFYFISN